MRLTYGLLLSVPLAAGTAARRNAIAPGSDGADGAAADPQPFLAEANDTMLRLSNEGHQAGWVANTYMTADTEAIYGSAAAGQRLQRTLAMGASRPWPDALEALTGQRQMDATAMADYFAPLKSWLDGQNRGQKVGW